jgi:hypothetical protein
VASARELAVALARAPAPGVAELVLAGVVRGRAELELAVEAQNRPGSG